MGGGLTHLMELPINEYVLDHLDDAARLSVPPTGASIIAGMTSPVRRMVFFEYVEVLFASGIADKLNSNPRINMCAITSDCGSMRELLDFMRGNYGVDDYRHIIEFNCEEVYRWSIHTMSIHKTGVPVDLFIFDILDPNTGKNCSHRALLVMCMVVRWQICNGTCIIRMGGDMHQTTADLIFCMASMFTSSMLVKPGVGDPLSSVRYLVSQNFRSGHVNSQELGKRVATHLIPYAAGDYPIQSILEHPPPYFFSVKIEEFNLMVAQHQLDVADGVQPAHSQLLLKWAAWCDKHRLPRTHVAGGGPPVTGNIFTDAI
jgi:hypothetical protein